MTVASSLAISPPQSGSQEFIGLELKENDSTNTVRVRARYQVPGTGGADSAWTTVSTNGNHTFSYTYDPSLGTNGRLTVQIDAQSALTVDLTNGERTSGGQFNGFGMGYTSNLNSENNTSKTAQVFIDDVTYSGFQASSLPAVSVTTNPASATEGGAGGTFIVSRSTTTGDLTVNYTLSGTATNNSDYASLSGSVVIPNGLASIPIAVSPLDDTTPESPESVILTISSSSNYSIAGSPANSATVTIADNDVGFTTDPGWVGVDNKATSAGTNYGWSSSGTQAGGSAGEVGGTFSRYRTKAHMVTSTLARHSISIRPSPRPACSTSTHFHKSRLRWRVLHRPLFGVARRGSTRIHRHRVLRVDFHIAPRSGTHVSAQW